MRKIAAVCLFLQFSFVSFSQESAPPDSDKSSSYKSGFEINMNSFVTGFTEDLTLSFALGYHIKHFSFLIGPDVGESNDGLSDFFKGGTLLVKAYPTVRDGKFDTFAFTSLHYHETKSNIYGYPYYPGIQETQSLAQHFGIGSEYKIGPKFYSELMIGFGLTTSREQNQTDNSADLIYFPYETEFGQSIRTTGIIRAGMGYRF